MDLARDTGLPLAVRSGGHSLAGQSTVDDAIVLDLGGLTSIAVDPEARTVHAGSGLTAGALSAATQAHGLIVRSATRRVSGSAGSPSAAASAG